MQRDRWADHRSAFGSAARATWLPWVLSRLLTLLALGLARYEVRSLPINAPKARGAAHSGLLVADANWYRLIAVGGYGIGKGSLRFFPLWPLLVRVVHDVTSIPAGGVLIGLANVAAFGAMMLVHTIARRELGDSDAASKAVWLFALFPAAFVLTMGYSESLFILLSAATLLCLRKRSWLWAGAWGFLAGTCRPLGFLLVVPAVIEVWRAHSWRLGVVVTRGIAVVAPIAGCASYLLWAQATYGYGLLEPFRLQHTGEPKAISSNPLVNLYHDARNAAHGTHFGSALHLPWVALVVVMVFVTWRFVPRSLGAYSAVVIAVAIAGSVNFESFERYALSAVPLFVGAAPLLKRTSVASTVFVLSAVCMFGYALLAFLGAYVP